MKKKNIFISIAIILFLTLFTVSFFTLNKSTLILPEIKVNPYKRNPLCALVSFNTKEPVKVQLTVKGKNGAQDIKHEFSEFLTHHEIPVLGLYPDYKNKVIIETINSEGKTKKKVLRIRTEKLNSKINIEIADKTVKNPKYYFMTEGFVFDEEGNIRLFFENNGEMVYYLNNELISENRIGGLTRYSLLGEELQKYSFPEYFTSFAHGMAQKPNGNFLVLGSSQNKKIFYKGESITTQGDFIIEINYKTGKVDNVIDLAEILNPFREVNVIRINNKFGIQNWCHVNGVDYDTSDNSIITTCRNAGIFKIEDRTNQLIWIIAPNKGFEISGRDGKGPDISNKVLIAVDKNDVPFKKEIQQGAFSNSLFKWPVSSHNAQMYQDKILAVYDNSGSIFDTSVYTTQTSNASIFKIDEKNKTIKQIWLQPLESYSHSSSSVTYNAKDNDVVVFSESIWHKNRPELNGYNILTRYDFNTQKVLFSALIHYNGSISYLYKNFEFKFYPDNN